MVSVGEGRLAEESHIVKLIHECRFRSFMKPLLLNATLQHHIEQYCTSHPELVDIPMQSTYIDYVIFGADIEEEGFALYMSSKEIFAQGSFIENHVNKIHKLFPANCWAHVSGKENQADIPSRGMALLELSLNPM